MSISIKVHISWVPLDDSQGLITQNIPKELTQRTKNERGNSVKAYQT